MTTTVTTIAADLEAAEKDLALLERLNSAKKRVAQLTKDLKAAQAAEDREEAAKAEAAEAAQKAQMAAITNIRVVAANAGTGPLHRDWQITFTRPAWDYTVNMTRPMDVTVQGFLNLARLYPLALRALIENFPERIPHEIASLADDPNEAIEIFLAAQQRGSLRARSIA